MFGSEAANLTVDHGTPLLGEALAHENLLSLGQRGGVTASVLAGVLLRGLAVLAVGVAVTLVGACLLVLAHEYRISAQYSLVKRVDIQR